MRLEVGADPVRLGLAAVADRFERFAHADAVRVFVLQDVFHRVDPGEDARAHHGGDEARALFVGPARHFERRARRDPPIVQRPHHLEPGHDAVGAVEPATVRLRVEMAAHDDGRGAGVLPGPAREHVADGVHPQLEARLAAPKGEALAPLAVGGCQRDAAYAALRRGADFRQLDERGPEARGVDARSGHAPILELPLEQRADARVRARVGEADDAVDLQLPFGRHALRPERGQLAHLRAPVHDVRPVVVRQANALLLRHAVRGADGGVGNVAQSDAGRVAVDAVADRAEQRRGVERLEEVELHRVVELAGAEALLLVGRGQLDLRAEVEAEAALALVEDVVEAAQHDVAETRFGAARVVHAGNDHAVGARADDVARPGDAQPRQGCLEHPGAGLVPHDEGNVERLGRFGRAVPAGRVFRAYGQAGLRGGVARG